MAENLAFGEPQATKRRPMVLAILLAVLLAALAALVSTSTLMCSDEAMWSYVGRQWLAGEPPYVGTVEQKPPGILMIYTLSNVLVGPAVWLPRLLGALALAGASLTVYSIGRRLHRPSTGLLAMVFCGLAVLWKAVEGYHVGHTEDFMLLAWLLSFLAVVATRGCRSVARHAGLMLAAGLSLGAAISFKQVVLFSAIGLFVLYLDLKRRGWSAHMRVVRDTGLYILGTFLGLALMTLPLLLSGVTLGQYFSGSWLILFDHGATNPWMLGRILKFLDAWQQSQLVIYYPLVILFLAQRRAIQRAGLPYWGLVAWLLVDVAGTISTGYIYPHQLKQAIPALSLASAIGLGMLISRFAADDALRHRRMVAAIVVAAAIWFPYQMVIWATRLRPAQDENRAVGLYIRGLTAAGDTVQTAGDQGNEILVWSGRKAPSRFFNQMFLRIRGAEQQFRSDLNRRPPRLMVFPAAWRAERDNLPEPFWPWVGQMVHDSYRLKETWHGYDIFELGSKEAEHGPGLR